MKRIVAFGEVMARLAAPGRLRLRQALPGALEVTFAGAEANVAASLSMLGAEAALASALPANPIADACVGTLRGLGVDTKPVLRTAEGRLGLYFLESGANQRPSHVVYDREGSAISVTPPEAYDWSSILRGASWFHVTGITPSLSRAAADASLAAAEAARAHDATVSCDLNFRKKLWRWDPDRTPGALAESIMRRILPHVDVVIANEGDCADVLGIRAGASDVESGHLELDHYPDVARQLVSQFPNVQHVAITLRESISATHNNWGAMLYAAREDHACFAPLVDGAYQPYRITDIIDRVGGGDSFAAGLIFALLTPELSTPQTALNFAVAASCLAHSIKGDFNFSTRREVEALMHGSSSGRVVR